MQYSVWTSSKGKTPYFGAIDKAKFRKKVVPGDTLRLEVTFTKLRGNAGIGAGVAYVDGKKVAEANAYIHDRLTARFNTVYL